MCCSELQCAAHIVNLVQQQHIIHTYTHTHAHTQTHLEPHQPDNFFSHTHTLSLTLFFFLSLSLSRARALSLYLCVCVCYTLANPCFVSLSTPHLHPYPEHATFLNAYPPSHIFCFKNKKSAKYSRVALMQYASPLKRYQPHMYAFHQKKKPATHATKKKSYTFAVVPYGHERLFICLICFPHTHTHTRHSHIFASRSLAVRLRASLHLSHWYKRLLQTALESHIITEYWAGQSDIENFPLSLLNPAEMGVWMWVWV